ncbi:MAG: response regulator [Deltaproteobacteria bacterium]|nr:MAG: response regulator [Deltaproteobacteria bacterium]RLA97587.1 MAG: response regulator [Deltaproteobacteria bacterium]
MRRALVVDDSLVVRNYHISLLKTLSFEVETAENGAEAYEKCLQNFYDLILCDINMPVMDGYRFTKKVRKLDDYEKVPIILVTTLNSEQDRKKALLAGATLFVVKPMNFDILKKMLEAVS